MPKTSATGVPGAVLPGATSSGAVDAQPPVGSAPLAAPAPITPAVSPPLGGEGQWHAAGRQVDGKAAVYETTLRPAASQPVAGVAWMDTALLAARLYSGSESPGGGPWKYSAPIKPAAANSLVAAFNGGFLMAVAQGGYYTQGRVVVPLRAGAASLVVYRDGSVTVGQWGRDVTMTPQVTDVRQNLRLLVDGGAPVPGLDPADTTAWGATLGNVPNVWRSGVGVTASGALVYVSGPGLDITQLADLLVQAGAIRAMELDINTDWTCLATYSPVSPSTTAAPANGTDLLSSMHQGPYLFFEGSWPRDFVTMSARAGPIP